MIPVRETQCYVISFMCDKRENVLSIPRASPVNDCCFLLFFLLFSLMMSVLFSWENAVKVIIIILKQCVISIQFAWSQNKITVPRIICRSYIFMNVVYWNESLRLEHQSAQGQYYLTHTHTKKKPVDYENSIVQFESEVACLTQKVT